LPTVPIVAFNGAVIRWTGGGEFLYRCCLPADAASEVVQYCRDQQLHLHYYLEDDMFATEDNRWSRAYCERAGMDFRVVPDMRVFAGQEPVKLLVIDWPAKIDQLLPQCQDRWRDRLYVTKSMPEYLEFLAPQVSKGRALQWLIDFYGVTRQDTLAIGDSMNDLPLLQQAGHAAAMPHSHADVKQCAQFVPADQATGVAAAIEWFLAAR
jgi:Cof subfamily protein (haloacid dehalogenase superfamily)